MAMVPEVAEPRPTRGRPRKQARVTGRRPRQQVADIQPREEILKVAASLFALKGYAGTTMAEIADVVGIRSPSLYYHFKDKSEILRAIADTILDVAVSQSEKMLKTRGAPAAKRLRDLVSDLVYRLRTSPYEPNCMFDPAFHSDEFRSINKKLQAWLANLESIIRQGIDERSFAPQNSKVATYTVRGLVDSAIRQVGGYSKMSPRETADYVANFAVRGLSAKST